MPYKTNYWIFIFAIGFFSCRTHRSTLTIQKIDISFLGGNNYPTISNQGGFEFYIIDKDSTIKNLNKFDVYSPSKKPIVVKLNRKQNSVILSNHKGNEFNLAKLDSSKNDCNYNCQSYFYKGDKVSFTSSLAFFPYWHGFSPLGGHPLFMRRHYYTLIVKKPNGEKLIMTWTYSLQKYKPYKSNRKIWSSDYCVDNGGGLTELKLKY